MSAAGEVAAAPVSAVTSGGGSSAIVPTDSVTSAASGSQKTAESANKEAAKQTESSTSESASNEHAKGAESSPAESSGESAQNAGYKHTSMHNHKEFSADDVPTGPSEYAYDKVKEHGRKKPVYETLSDEAAHSD